MPLDGVTTSAIEGTADRMWLETVDRRAEAAAVNAMASGSQHRTISAISHRMARSLSVSEAISSATWLIGVVWVSLCRPLAATLSCSAYRAAKLGSQLSYSRSRSFWRSIPTTSWMKVRKTFSDSLFC